MRISNKYSIGFVYFKPALYVWNKRTLHSNFDGEKEQWWCHMPIFSPLVVLLPLKMIHICLLRVSVQRQLNFMRWYTQMGFCRRFFLFYFILYVRLFSNLSYIFGLQTFIYDSSLCARISSCINWYKRESKTNAAVHNSMSRITAYMRPFWITNNRFSLNWRTRRK